MTTQYFLTHMHLHGMTKDDVLWLLAGGGVVSFLGHGAAPHSSALQWGSGVGARWPFPGGSARVPRSARRPSSHGAWRDDGTGPVGSHGRDGKA